MNTLTVDRLKQLFSYNPETGDFTYLTQASKKTKIGDIAGGLDDQGYRRIRVDGKKYRAHRLAFFYMTGKWPTDDLDHHDLNKDNNRWGNIRTASKSQNMANKSTPKNNTSGFKGVYWRKKSNAWYAVIGVNGKQQHLGQYTCPVAAHLSYIVAANKEFGEFARAG